MSKETIKFDTYTFTFPITTSDEVCNEKWVSELKSNIDDSANISNAKGKLDLVKTQTSHEFCEIDGVVELSTIAQNITDDINVYEEQIKNTLTLIDNIVEEQKSKDEKIISAYSKVEEAAEAYRSAEIKRQEYNNKKSQAESDPENATKASLKDTAYSQYSDALETYNGILSEAKTLFSTAQGMEPTVGYDDLTMSG